MAESRADEQLGKCVASFAALEKRLKKVEQEIENLKAQLLGAHGDIGLLKEIQGELQACYSSLGKVQGQLMKVKEALR